MSVYATKIIVRTTVLPPEAPSSSVNTTKTITGLARIQKQTLSTITGIARIQLISSRTITGLASLAVSSINTITGVSRISSFTNNSITGIARIQASSTYTITGLAKVVILKSYEITGLARISLSSNKTITGLSRIEKTTFYTTTGLGRIQLSTIFTETGLARISSNSLYTITGIARVISIIDTTRTITGVARIQTVVLRPISDIETNSWTTPPLYSNINEISPNDASFIQSSGITNNSCLMALTQITGQPIYKTGHHIRYRIQKSYVSESEQINLTVSLYQGSALIASGIHTNVPYGFFTTGFTLTEAQANNISDYTNLRLKFTTNPN